MGSFSDYWEDEILDHLFSKGSHTPPIIYVGLSTADPGDDAAGLAEPSGNGYVRVQTAAGDWDFASGGSLDNANTIEFPGATGDWGAITHFALFDTASGGHMLAHGSLSASKTVASGDTIRFAVGELNVTLD